jgi:hypothetical protein
MQIGKLQLETQFILSAYYSNIALHTAYVLFLTEKYHFQRFSRDSGSVLCIDTCRNFVVKVELDRPSILRCLVHTYTFMLFRFYLQSHISTYAS